MTKLMTISFFIYFGKIQAQASKISGTWVNTEIYNAVQHGTMGLDFDSIVPRCIYIDLNGKITVEFRYEQKSKTSAIGKISIKGDTTFFNSMERNFAIIGDSILLLLNRYHIFTFKKVSNQALIGNGIQELLRDYFWGKHRKWKVITFKNGNPTDTTIANIENSRINSDAHKEIFRYYEFTDVKKYNVNRQQLFGIGFSNVNNKNMSDSIEVFRIRKSGRDVCLYKGDMLNYNFSPLD